MKTLDINKVTSKLFCKDIRDKNFNEYFGEIFGLEITDFLSEYDYDEIDEYPIEIENKGIMIGFIAETIKVPPQIEYIDLDIHNYPQNINFSAKTIPHNFGFLKSEDIEKHLTPCANLRVYHSLYDIKQIDRVIFQNEDLRYELLIDEDHILTRIRICFNENESSVDMRTFYPFGGGGNVSD
jgi:hypothetical protein